MSASKISRKPTDNMDSDAQRSLLVEAKVAGTKGDDRLMVKNLVESRLLAGLHHRLAAKISARSGRRCDEDDVDDALDLAVTNLFSTLSMGWRVSDIGAFLYRAAERRAVDLHRRRRETSISDPSTLTAKAGADDSILDKLAREDDQMFAVGDPDAGAAARRKSGLKIVRRLLPEMKLARSQQVIEYILDAMADGVEDISDEKIGEALGITTEAVRKARERGFARLKKLAIKHGYSTGALECIPDRSDDND